MSEIGDLNDGDEFVWEADEEPAPVSDHSSSHHYFLDLAAMRARANYGKAKRRRRVRVPEGGGASAVLIIVEAPPPEAA